MLFAFMSLIFQCVIYVYILYFTVYLYIIQFNLHIFCGRTAVAARAATTTTKKEYEILWKTNVSILAVALLAIFRWMPMLLLMVVLAVW